MPYITIPQLAEMMGVSRTTVYRRVKSGEILAERVGHAHLIPEGEVHRLLSTELTESDKERIDRAVKKAIKEYGEVLKRLGEE